MHNCTYRPRLRFIGEEETGGTTTEETQAVEETAATPVVDESAAMLDAANAKIASLTIELEAIKAELVTTKAANWDLVTAAAGPDAAVTDPENATENDDTDTEDEPDVDDFFGDRED